MSMLELRAAASGGRAGGGGGKNNKHGNSNARGARRVAMAILESMRANPALSMCVSVDVDMTSAGAPGLTVNLGLAGEVSLDICNWCWKWTCKVRATRTVHVVLTLVMCHPT